MKYSEVTLIYTSPAFCPEDIKLDKAYHLLKKDGKLYFTDGVKEFEGEESFVKMLFTPKECNWEQVDFTNKIEFVKMVDK